jgi:hypothetical protein
LFGVVLDHLEISMVQVELAVEGVADVEGFRVMAISIELAHHRLVDELVAAALDGASC